MSKSDEVNDNMMLEGSTVYSATGAGAGSKRGQYTKGPNAQALSLQQKYDGTPVRTLSQQYVTPITVNMPSYHNDVVYHRPTGMDGGAPVLGGQQVGARGGLRPNVSEIMRGSVDTLAIAAAKTILDGFVLLSASGMEFPDDARVATIANKGLTTVVAEDMDYFNNLAFLDISENSLDLESFAAMPALVELRMAANNVVRIQV
jgi:hypothetical protein